MRHAEHVAEEHVGELSRKAMLWMENTVFTLRYSGHVHEPRAGTRCERGVPVVAVQDVAHEAVGQVLVARRRP